MHTAPPAPRRSLAVTILAASSLTVMSGATLAAALPGIEAAHRGTFECATLARLVLTAPALAIALVAPVAGVLIDRMGRRRLLVAALVLHALAGTAGLWSPGLAMLLASRVALGTAIAFTMTVATTLIGDHFAGGERRRFLGLQGAVMSLCGAALLVAGGALADVSWRAPFVVYASSLLVVPFAILAVPDAPADDIATARRRPTVRTPFSALFAVYGLAFSGMTLFYMIPVQLPFVLENVMCLDGTCTGLVIAGATCAAAASASQYRRIRAHLSEYGVAAAMLATMGAGFALVALAPGVPVVLVAMVLVGAGVGVLVPHCNSWVLCLIPAAARGRALGGLTSAFFAGQFVSPLVAKPALDWAGHQGQFVVAGAVLAVAAVVFAMLTRVHARLV